MAGTPKRAMDAGFAGQAVTLWELGRIAGAKILGVEPPLAGELCALDFLLVKTLTAIDDCLRPLPGRD